MDYQVPNVLDAATAIFMEYSVNGTRLYHDNPYKYTRCQETTFGYPITVGAFTPDGLQIDSGRFDVVNIGIAGLRKL